MRSDSLLFRMADYQTALFQKIATVDRFLAERQQVGQTFYPRSPTAVLRANLILEEAKELADALLNGTEEEVLKESADLLVVNLGTSVVYEHPIIAAYNRVMDNNLARVINGTVREDGKLIKPEGFPKPYLKDLLP